MMVASPAGLDTTSSIAASSIDIGGEKGNALTWNSTGRHE